MALEDSVAKLADAFSGLSDAIAADTETLLAQLAELQATFEQIDGIDLATPPEKRPRSR